MKAKDSPQTSASLQASTPFSLPTTNQGMQHQLKVACNCINRLWRRSCEQDLILLLTGSPYPDLWWIVPLQPVKGPCLPWPLSSRLSQLFLTMTHHLILCTTLTTLSVRRQMRSMPTLYTYLFTCLGTYRSCCRSPARATTYSLRSFSDPNSTE